MLDASDPMKQWNPSASELPLSISFFYNQSISMHGELKHLTHRECMLMDIAVDQCMRIELAAIKTLIA